MERPAEHPPAAGVISRRLGAAILVAVAGLGALLFGFGLLDQARRLAAYHAAGLGYPDPGCGVPFCDSSVFWLAGRLARAGTAAAALYGAPAFNAYATATLPGHAGNFPFVYTPITLLAAIIISVPSLPVAYFGFTLVTIAAFIALLRRAGLPWPAILLGLASPAAMWSIYLGQFGLPCGALLIAGLAELGRRPWQAGILLGLLAIKPPYAFAAPFVVLAGRHWRALLAGGLTLAALIGLTLACFGTASWAAFLGPGRIVAQDLLTAPFSPHGVTVPGVSLFWMLRSLGAPLFAAAALQAAAAMLAARLLIHLWRRPAPDPAARLLATICLVVLATPYGYTDDLVALSTALPLLLRRHTPLANALLALVWISPAGTLFFLHTLGFLPEPLFIAAALLLALSRLMLQSAPATPPLPS